MIHVLDQGYVKPITIWGSDELIIESARMSTAKGFEGWEATESAALCKTCSLTIPISSLDLSSGEARCPNDNSLMILKRGQGGDAKLLKYLYEHKHMTPFEMCGMTVEVKLPIFVVREWHRHRTQGYSEMSARYVPMPDENYMPTKQRIINGVHGAGVNRQAQGAIDLDISAIDTWLDQLQDVYDHAQKVYENGLNIGIPKEVARLVVPVARYTRMRATANLRNWLAFLLLRDSKNAPGAQWEIRQYADAVGTLIGQSFPRTYSLFNEK